MAASMRHRRRGGKTDPGSSPRPASVIFGLDTSVKKHLAHAFLAAS
jgi:hypothetical protein